MARRNVDTRTSKYTIGFVCEGEKSEPFFIRRLHATLQNDSFNIDVHPLAQEELRLNQTTTNVRREGTRLVNNRTMPDPLLKSYYGKPQPTNWVLAGEELLDTCNEVWVLFDKDGHPDMQNAFTEIDRIRQTQSNYNVVFSSRCFEYYILMHYEYSTMPYAKAECNHKENGKTIFENCCTPNATSNACDGELCINGHARLCKYWTDSKNHYVYDICRNLWWGILNSFHVKWNSLLSNRTQKIYDRNPYLNIYHLTLRMIGMGCLEPFEPPIIRELGNGTHHTLNRNGDNLHIECHSPIPIRNIELQEYRLLTDAELQAKGKKDLHIQDCLVQTHTIMLNLSKGQTIDINLIQYGLNAIDKYGIIEWDNIKYFVAPILKHIMISQVEYNAQRVEHVDSILLKQKYTPSSLH